MLVSIICPITDDQKNIDKWLNCLKNNVSHELKNISQLIIIDTRDGKITNKISNDIYNLGYKKTDIIKYNQNIDIMNKDYQYFIKKGSCVANTQQIVSDSNLLLDSIFTVTYEEDIIFEKYSIEQLIQDFIKLYKRKACLFLSAIAVAKNNKNKLITTIKGNEISLEFINKNNAIFHEVNATNNGLAITFTDLFKIFYQKYCVPIHYASPDFAFSDFIRNTIYGKVYITKNIYLTHVSQNKKYGIKKVNITFDNNKILDLIKNVNLNITFNKRKRKSPILICGLGGKSGSMYIQKYICSKQNCIIYGETHGMIDLIFNYIKNIFYIRNKRVVEYSTNKFIKNGCNNFIANMSPILNIDMKHEARRIINSFYVRNNNINWGIKNIKQPAYLLTLFFTLYKDITYIFIEREKELQYKAYMKVRHYQDMEKDIFKFQENLNNVKRKSFKNVFKNYNNMLQLKYDDSKNIINTVEKFLNT